MSQAPEETGAYHNIFAKKSLMASRTKIVSISSQKMKKGQVLADQYSNLHNFNEETADANHMKRSTVSIKSRNNNIKEKTNSMTSALSHHIPSNNNSDLNFNNDVSSKFLTNKQLPSRVDLSHQIVPNQKIRVKNQRSTMKQI